MTTLPPSLAPLGARAQFVTWFSAPIVEKPGKFNKFPCDWRTGAVVGASARDTWTSWDVAAAIAPSYDRGHGAGIGFCFTAEDPYFFLDIDSCLLPDGTWSPLAQQLCARLPGAAVEISFSGRGLHIIGRMSRALAHACRNTPLGLELYTADRFVALTGTGAQGNVEQDCTAALEQIIAEFFAPNAAGEWGGWTSAPVEGWSGPPDDDELIRKAIASGARNAGAVFGHAVAFGDLWVADVDKLARQWPGEGLKPYGASEADQALANHLAFWTGKNCERMEALMRRSALARDKWDTHRSYLGDTIIKACAFVQNVATGYTAPVAPIVAPEVLQAAAVDAGRQLREVGREYMTVYEQIEHFAGCAYVNDLQRIWSTPKGALFSRISFDVVYGGYLFVINPDGNKTTASAWEAFTLSRVNAPAIVDDLCFRPEIAPGAVVLAGNRALVNSYVPYDCPAAPGDVSPFLDLLAKMLPVDEDRRILLNYMASLAQNPGRKFQWWPVIQGVKGNGKTTLLEAMTHIVGEQYTHLPNATAMARDGMKFNGWIHRNLFIGLEEVALSHKREFLEEFKVVVTGRRLGVEKKGAEQFMGDNRVNGLILTNHRNGVPIEDDERRYAVFFCAQQRAADLARDGMDGTYFPDLIGWFRGEDAYAGRTPGSHHIAHFLKTFAIEAAYDPAGLSHRAPQTSSTRAAVEFSLGRMEQEIVEAIEEGRPGFCGGWVSSRYLDSLIDSMRIALPRNQRRDVMEALGYEWHPALRDGRVNETVNPDAGKPKLYLKKGHLAFNLTEPADIARAYSKAQEPSAAAASPALVVFGKPA